MSNYKKERNYSLIRLIILLIIFGIIEKANAQFTQFQIISNKNVTEQDCEAFLKISARTLDKLLCLSYCPRVECNLISFDSNNNQCRLYNVSSSVLQQTGLSFIDSPGTNLFISKPYIKAFNGIFKSIISIHNSAVRVVIKLSNGDLASGSGDLTVKIFNEDGFVKKSLSGPSYAIYSLLEFQNEYLAAGTFMHIHIWNMNTWSHVPILNAHSSWISSMIYIPSISRVASSSQDTTIKIWDLINGVLIATLTGHTGWIMPLVLLPNGDLASGSGDDTIKIWDSINFNLKYTLNFAGTAIRAMIVLQDGNVASGFDDSNIRIWRPSDRTLMKTLSGHSSAVFSLLQFPNGDLVSGYQNGSINIFNLETGVIKYSLSRHSVIISSLVRLDNGNLLSSSYHDSSMIIWE
jgi:WD40 repeat protein